MADYTGTGSPQAQAATVSGSGEVIRDATGAVTAQAATVSGAGDNIVPATGSPQAQSATTTASAIGGPTGAPEIPFNQTVSGITGVCSLTFKQRVGETATVEFYVNQTVSALTGTVSLPINQKVGETDTVSMPVDQRVTDLSNLTSPVHWKPLVTLGGTDISARLVGAIRIEMEESAARICEFDMEPASGAVTITDWVGADVTVDFVQTDSDGDETQRWRRFTGVVDLPEYDPVTGVVSFRCTDQLQEILDNMAQADIDTLIDGSYWSSDIFDEDVSGWERAQDRLTTVPYALELNESRMPRYTAWEAKGTADVTYTESEIDDLSLRISLATRRDLHNVLNLTINYRYERLYYRPETVGWSYPYTFCQYLNDSTTLPNTEMVKSALESTGWLIDSLAFRPPPPSGNVYNVCGGSVAGFRGWVNTKNILFGFNAKLVKQWTQTVTETYNVTLRAEGSITTHGEIPRSETVSFQTEYDYESFENEPGAKPEDGDNPASLVSYAPDSVDDDPMKGWSGAYPAPAGATADSSGDYIASQADRTQSDNTIKTIIAQEKTQMLGAHRQNTVTFNTDLAPWLGLELTARVNTTRIDATGKIRHIVETMNIDSGEATSTVTLAVSRGGGSVDTTIIAPTPPTTTVAARGSSSTLSSGLPSRFGAIAGALPYSDNWEGYTGNYASVFDVDPGVPIYPVRLKINLDEIESDRRDEETPSTAMTFSVQIPNDSLTITH